MTSNVGSQFVAAVAGTSRDDAGYERMKAQVTESLRAAFRPEFLNRIDEVIVFHSLTDADLERIVDLLLADLQAPARRSRPDPRAHAGGPGRHRPRGPRPAVRGAAAQAVAPAAGREPARAGAPRGRVRAGRPHPAGRGPGRRHARVQRRGRRAPWSPDAGRRDARAAEQEPAAVGRSEVPSSTCPGDRWRRQRPPQLSPTARVSVAGTAGCTRTRVGRPGSRRLATRGSWHASGTRSRARPAAASRSPGSWSARSREPGLGYYATSRAAAHPGGRLPHGPGAAPLLRQVPRDAPWPRAGPRSARRHGSRSVSPVQDEGRFVTPCWPVSRLTARASPRPSRGSPWTCRGGTRTLPRMAQVDAVVANEYLDALPVHRLVVVDGTIRESWVTWTDGQVRVGGWASSRRRHCAEPLLAAGVTLREGQVLEVRPADRRLGRGGGTAARARACVLVIDYGHETRELYGTRRLRRDAHDVPRTRAWTTTRSRPSASRTSRPTSTSASCVAQRTRTASWPVSDTSLGQLARGAGAGRAAERPRAAAGERPAGLCRCPCGGPAPARPTPSGRAARAHLRAGMTARCD